MLAFILHPFGAKKAFFLPQNTKPIFGHAHSIICILFYPPKKLPII
jgi:hypothetical protein